MGGETAVHDAIVIGGGFYGSAIAVYLSRQRGFRNVLLFEREPALMTRASYRNQARAHNGYHYPRSFTTAYRSRINLPRFVQDWPDAISKDFRKLYAIARRNSKVTARQFARFCREIGAPLEAAPLDLRALFEPRLIEEIFLVQEYAFDAAKIAGWANTELHECGVHIRLDTRVTDIQLGRNGTIGVAYRSGQDAAQTASCRYVFNCTYSGINQFGGDFPGTRTRLKHEITEMALMRLPPMLQGLAVTVMDGPFFSLMPFPARKLHTLSHVRYTPHLHWDDSQGNDPYERLDQYDGQTRVDRMLRDVIRYLPCMAEAEYVESLFEVKTVLAKSEGDDGRPILFEKNAPLPHCYTILGGKIDNIYDVLETLDAEETLRTPAV
jgi:glycine/D-amino acid oxidase-like deaminating enzyme